MFGQNGSSDGRKGALEPHSPLDANLGSGVWVPVGPKTLATLE